METSSSSFIGRVRSQLTMLPAKERRLADFLLEFPGDLASYTATELATLAGVSNATVTRFIRRLGYPGYEEARRHVRGEKASGSPLFFSAADNDGQAPSVEAQVVRSQANLAATFSRITEQQITEIAQAVVAARRVLVFGYRSSHAFALYFRWQIIQVVENTLALPGPGETVGEYLGGITSDDCVIVFGVRRRVRQLTDILDYAANAGAQVLYVSDRHAAGHAGATWSIQCDTLGTGPLDDHAAVIALCGALATKVLALAGVAGRRRLAAIELAHDALREL